VGEASEGRDRCRKTPNGKKSRGSPAEQKALRTSGSASVNHIKKKKVSQKNGAHGARNVRGVQKEEMLGIKKAGSLPRHEEKGGCVEEKGERIDRRVAAGLQGRKREREGKKPISKEPLSRQSHMS